MPTVIGLINLLNSPGGQAAITASADLLDKGLTLLEKLFDHEKAATAATGVANQ